MHGAGDLAAEQGPLDGIFGGLSGTEPAIPKQRESGPENTIVSVSGEGP
jgi:hypothetical protein